MKYLREQASFLKSVILDMACTAVSEDVTYVSKKNTKILSDFVKFTKDVAVRLDCDDTQAWRDLAGMADFIYLARLALTEGRQSDFYFHCLDAHRLARRLEIELRRRVSWRYSSVFRFFSTTRPLLYFSVLVVFALGVIFGLMSAFVRFVSGRS